jgi:DNA-binding transcriptional ArsR family regulator
LAGSVARVATELVRIGVLLADRTRAEILTALLDGRAHTGSELARHIGVSASTVSEHLAKLLDAGLVRVEAQGRHRYWRLAGSAVAELLETVGAATATVMPPPPRAPHHLAVARTCYDHLAGALAVAVFDRLVTDGHLVHAGSDLTLTAAGVERLSSLGAHVAVTSRPLARPCLDWTERTHHLAGDGGRALLDAFFANGWLRRGHRPRSVELTTPGREAFASHFGWTG